MKKSNYEVTGGDFSRFRNSLNSSITKSVAQKQGPYIRASANFPKIENQHNNTIGA